VDHFDVVAIGIEEESGVVTRMIFPFAGSAVVAAARLQSGTPGLVDHLATVGLKGQMHAGALFARVDPELVGCKMLVVAHDRDAENLEDGRVETLAGRQIPGPEVDMVNKAAAMQFLEWRSPPAFNARSPDRFLVGTTAVPQKSAVTRGTPGGCRKTRTVEARPPCR
jgi:hypothetical protein